MIATVEYFDEPVKEIHSFQISPTKEKYRKVPYFTKFVMHTKNKKWFGESVP